MGLMSSIKGAVKSVKKTVAKTPLPAVQKIVRNATEKAADAANVGSFARVITRQATAEAALNPKAAAKVLVNYTIEGAKLLPRAAAAISSGGATETATLLTAANRLTGNKVNVQGLEALTSVAGAAYGDYSAGKGVSFDSVLNVASAAKGAINKAGQVVTPAPAQGRLEQPQAPQLTFADTLSIARAQDANQVNKLALSAVDDVGRLSVGGFGLVQGIGLPAAVQDTVDAAAGGDKQLLLILAAVAIIAGMMLNK